MDGFGQSLKLYRACDPLSGRGIRFLTQNESGRGSGCNVENIT